MKTSEFNKICSELEEWVKTQPSYICIWDNEDNLDKNGNYKKLRLANVRTQRFPELFPDYWDLGNCACDQTYTSLTVAQIKSFLTEDVFGSNNKPDYNDNLYFLNHPELKLTPSNRVILQMYCDGKTSSEICKEFKLTSTALRARVLYMKKHNKCRTREQLIAQFVRGEL